MKFWILFLFLCIKFAFADNSITAIDTGNFLPKGEYRLFGEGRGYVSNVERKIRSESSYSQINGNIQTDVKTYQGRLTYQQNFENHGWQKHQPFSNIIQREFNSETSKPTIGGQTFTNLKVKAYEIHPADAYDGQRGGNYPTPTGARDEYVYDMAATEINSKIILDKQEKPQTAFLDNSARNSFNFDELNQAQNISHTSFTYDEKSDYVHLNFSNTYNNNTNRSSRNWEDITKTLSSMSNAEVSNYFSNEDNLVDFFASGNASVVYFNTPPSISSNIPQTNSINNSQNNSGNDDYNIYISDEELYNPENLYARVNLLKVFSSTAKKVSKKSNKKKTKELKKARERIDNLSQKNRDNEKFTKAGKDAIKNENKIRNDGYYRCENCGTEVFPAKKHQKGVSPPNNEMHVDHKIPKSKGGSGNPDNGQILCRDCNLKKGNK